MGGIIPLTLIGIVYTLDLLNIEYLVTTRSPCLGEGRYWVGGGGWVGRFSERSGKGAQIMGAQVMIKIRGT